MVRSSAPSWNEAVMVAFGIVVVVVCVVSGVLAAAAFVKVGRLYGEIGQRGTLSMTHDDESRGPTREVVREEVREMLEAISAARRARGEPPLDSEPYEEALRQLRPADTTEGRSSARAG